MDAPRILLASGSPRRRELLAQMGLDCDVRPPDLDEDAFTQQDPLELVAALAHAKAAVVRETEPGAAERWILAADTVVAVDRENLGKPHTVTEAERMIRLLSGHTHRVVTGVCVWPPGEDEPDVRVAETSVSFDPLSAGEIDSYLSSEDWRDVAGGYRIQGRAALHIHSISGSYSNVVGLPIHLVYSIFSEHGFQGL